MPSYAVQRRYQAFSDGQQWGPWEPGDVVELDADRAAWVGRDAPGTLNVRTERHAVQERIGAAEKPAGADGKAEAETPAAPVRRRRASKREG